MPQAFLAQHINFESGYNQLLGKVYNTQPASVNKTIAQVAHHLDQYNVLNKIPIGQQASVQILNQELGNILVLTTFFPFIFLVVAALVVNVLLKRIVAQQRVIIGTLKSLGINNTKLCTHYICFGLVIGVFGWIVGTIFGVSLQYALLSFYRTVFIIPSLVFHIHPDVLLIGLFISLLTTFLGSIGGAVKAIRLPPAEAMRAESPTKGGRIILDHINAIWHNLTFRGKLVTRSIFRNKFRSTVTMTSTLVATSLLLSTLSLSDSVSKVVNFQFTNLSHQQITVTLRNPLGPSILSTFRATPGIKKWKHNYQ